MPALSDIDEVTEVTEEETNKGARSDKIDLSFRLSIDELDIESDCECSETAPTKASKTSRNPSIMLSIDKDVLHRLSKRDGESDDGSDMPQATLCCYCCCDVVRACIITNLLFIVGMVNLIMVSVFEIPSFSRFDLYQTYDDDDSYNNPYLVDDYFVNNTVEKRLDIRGILALTRTGCTIVFCLVGVVGAHNFNQNAVLSTAIWYIVYTVWSLIDRRMSGAVFALIFAYPNWHLFYELLRGTITKENYWNEKYCCCECCYCDDDE